MSNSSKPPSTGNGSKPRGQPRAIIHKQILDAAQSNPSASMEEVAAKVSGASVSLVERVLKEYGDPADTGDHGTDSPPPSSTTTGISSPTDLDGPPTNEHPQEKEPTTTDRTHLTEKQQQTLRTIFEHPDATQRELADLLDVCGATVNKRVNSIDGFEWKRRREFVSSLFEEEPMQNEKESKQAAEATGANMINVKNLADRIETLEANVETTSSQARSIPISAELVHKVIHACLSSDHISEDEELQLLKAFLNAQADRS